MCAAGAIWRKLSWNCMSAGSFFALGSVACAKFHNFCQAIVATSAAATATATAGARAGAGAAATVPRCLPVTCHSYRAINKTGGSVRTPSPSLHPPSLALVLTGASHRYLLALFRFILCAFPCSLFPLCFEIFPLSPSHRTC